MNDPSFAPYASIRHNNGLNVHGTLYPFSNPSADGLQLRRVDSATDGVVEELDAIVVGASWAGIWTLHKLQSLGLRVKLWDACSDVGGVWWYTRYPGCRVDTEVPFYEFSLPRLWEHWNWTQRFPSRAEIHSYLRWVCAELDLTKNIVFGTRVTAARWDGLRSRWHVSAESGRRATAQFLLPCAGYSTIRHIPDIPGLDKFPQRYHTSEWPEHLDCRGKRVGVLGTAASGIQVIEGLSKAVGHLTVFQRTPNLATPMRQVNYTAEDMARLKKSFPRRFAGRYSRNGFDHATARRSSDDTPEQRDKVYEELWSRGGLAFWFANYSDTLDDAAANARAYAFWRRKVRQRVHDRDTAEILAPIKPPHAFGTKRPSLENAYFEVFNQPNVDLVDLHSDPIVQVSARGITTASGNFHALDILAMATGFDFLTGSMLAMGIRGKDGIKLNDRWSVHEGGAGIFTHLGLATAGFPNLFFPMGPQAPSALGLTPQLAEVQGDWTASLIAWMKANGKTTVEATPEAEDVWKKATHRAADASLFSRTDGWYMG